MPALRRWQSLSGAVIFTMLAGPVIGPSAARASQSEIILDPAVDPAIAPHETYPHVSGQFIGYIENAHFYDVKGPEGSGLPSSWNTVDPFMQGAIVAKLTPTLAISGLAEFRSFATAPEDRAFEQLDGQLRNLFVTYDAGHTTLFAGKFEVGYGEAWQTVDGIYSGFSGDYSYPGSLGLGARWSWKNADSARHTLTSIVFKRDNTIFGHTWTKDYPALPQLEDGGPGNTHGLQSGGIAYDISDIPGLPGLRGGIAVGRMARGDGEADERGETGMSVTANYDTPLSETWGLRLFAEAVYLRGYMGRQAAATDTVLSASLSHGQMLYTLTAARRDLNAIQGSLADQGFVDNNDWGWSATAAYQTDFGLIVQAGFLRQQEQGVAFNQALLRLIYQTGWQ